MFANPITKKIEMTKTEAAKAGKFGTKEFEELGALMDRFSSYEIVVVKTNTKSVDHLKGLISLSEKVWMSTFGSLTFLILLVMRVLVYSSL